MFPLGLSPVFPVPLWVCAVLQFHSENWRIVQVCVSVVVLVSVVWLQVFTPAWSSVGAAGNCLSPLQGLFPLLSTGSALQPSQL